MSDLQLLWIIQLAPLAAFCFIYLLPTSLRKAAPAIGLLLALLAAFCSVRLLTAHADAADLPQQFVYPWLQVSSDVQLWPFTNIREYALEVGFLIDPLNLLMITVVTIITVFVQMFSYYYMADDPSRPRYFAFLSFFAFSMTGLVLSNNLLQTFLFWELVGLASYLLIGFWYQKKSASDAARKAFVINRLADLGFYVGIILLFLLTGSVSFVTMDARGLESALPAGTLALLGILVFTGVMGKSAQFPFHVWLPDAMEGPTPVSALIHSATMVAAGVFLLCRAFPLFSSSHTTLEVVLAAGTLTALTGALLALVQRDIKKILAYSTVSQLGLMAMSIGAGSTVAGMFHLTTHAFFKSMLFLTAGAFIHHFHTNDIWEIAAKGGKKETLPLVALAIGLLSLSGIFPFAGFFSKDLILETLHHEHKYYYFAALLVSFLTAFYSFRLLFVILFSKPETHAAKKHGHAHGSHEHHEEAHPLNAPLRICRSLPLLSLAVLSVLAGLKGTSVFDFKLLRWLGGHETHLNAEILITTSVLIVFAAGLAFIRYRNPEAASQRLETSRNGVVQLLKNKFYIDDAYAFLVKKIGLELAGILDWFDRVFVNGVLVNGTSYFILYIGRWFSKAQTGLVQDYLSWALALGVILLFWVARGL